MTRMRTAGSPSADGLLRDAPGVAQGNRAVEDRRIVAVGDEIAVPLELKALFALRVSHRGLELGGDDLLRLGVEVLQEIGIARARVRNTEQPVEEPHLRG